VPVLANITEFGKTPLFSVSELHGVGIRLVLYPLSAFRAMNRAAMDVYQSIRQNGTQQQMLERMQTREQLYDILDYHAYETKLDEAYARDKPTLIVSHKMAGLRGQAVGQTALSSVDNGAGLSYCGYDIVELAAQATFEEVAYLLAHDELPNAEQLHDYTNKLISLRTLPKSLKQALEQIPASTVPMDVLRTGCSILGILEPEQSFKDQFDIAERLLASLPAMMCYWYRYSHDGVRITTQTDDLSIAGYILHCLHDQPPDALAQRAMDVSLILYAEHEFNASTFTARVCASTLSDFYSAVCAAIGSLRGPLHGGANEAAMALINAYQTPEQAIKGVKKKLQDKEKIMGFGHAVYKASDPRNAIIKQWSKKLSLRADDDHLFAISIALEKLMWEEKRLYANLDFFSATSYHFLGIPRCLFTPIFVCSRIAGWAGHIFEQRKNNCLIRPRADYIGSAPRPYKAVEQRP
jgi:2-methylcitrate synthase